MDRSMKPQGDTRVLFRRPCVGRVSRRRLGACLLLALVGGALARRVDSHPPERHRPADGSRDGMHEADTGSRPDVPSDQDRHEAFAWYEFFIDLARRCPTSRQQAVVRQAVAEHRLATSSPSTITLAGVVAARAAVLADLQSTLPWSTAHWTAEGLHWRSDPPTFELVADEPRFVVVDIRNDTSEGLLIGVRSVDGRSAAPLAALGPSASRPFLVEIRSDHPTFEVVREADEPEVRRLACRVVETPPATLRLRLCDAASGAPVPGRVRIAATDGRVRHGGPFGRNPSYLEKPVLELPTMAPAAVPFFYADGQVEIDLPPGPTTITVERGFEHEPVTESVTLRGGESHDVTIVIRRLLDARALGWVSGDTHVHWVTNAWNVDLPLPDLALVQRAEDLRVVNNLTLLHRTATDAFVKPSQAPVGPVGAHSDGDYHVEMAEEYRNQNLYGHLCFLGLQWLVLPIGTGPQIAGEDALDYPLNKTAILEARGQGAVSIEAHGTGANHELPVNAIHGLVDSVDQLDALDYYRLLDCGFQLPLTNGSDHPARVAGAARAYVQIDGPFDYEKWIDGIRLGRTFTTSGPLLFLEVDGQGPGAVLVPDGSARCVARVRAVSRHPLGRVQIVSNGEVLAERVTTDRHCDLECPLPDTDSRWVVARCSGNGEWNAIWHPDVAHTSAVYVHRDGRPVFRAEAAADWIARMRLHARDILAKGRFASEPQRQAALDYVADGIRRYQRLVDGWSAPDRGREWLLMQAAFVSHRGHEPVFVERVSEASDADGLVAAVEPLTLLRVHVNPESRVKLGVVTPPGVLVQHRTTRFLVAVHNEAGIRAPLRIAAFDRTNLPSRDAAWCSMRIVENLVSSTRLSGAEHEWKILELRCTEAGRREVMLEADVGQGTQDLGFRATADLLLECVPRSVHRAGLSPALP